MENRVKREAPKKKKKKGGSGWENQGFRINGSGL